MPRRGDTVVTAIEGGAPPSASARSYLRRGMPVIYREDPRGVSDDPFAMRFLGGLEQVLDPVVAMADLLSAHFDPVTAPPAVIELFAAWLGLDIDRSLDQETARRLVLRASEITRARGTRAGIELLLECVYPMLDLTVTDSGGVWWSPDPKASSAAAAPMVTVTCPPDLTGSERAAILRIVTKVTPVHVRVELLPREVGSA